MVSVLSMVFFLASRVSSSAPGRSKYLQAAVEALHRLHRPRQAEVQAGLGVVGAVVGGDAPAELRQVDELGAVHGEDRQRADDGREQQQERRE